MLTLLFLVFLSNGCQGNNNQVFKSASFIGLPHFNASTNSSYKLTQSDIEGLPYQISVTGDDPILQYINETYLTNLLGGVIDEEFMMIKRPQFKRITRGSCKLKYRWYKQPLKIWPRWLQVRICFDKDYNVPGNVNKCRPVNYETKYILVYFCESVSGLKSCGWIKMSYPFITSCTNRE
jgi:hypothetical protein